MGKLIIRFSCWAANWLALSIGIGISIGIEFPENSDLNYVNGYSVPMFDSGPESQIVMSGETVVMSCCVERDNLQFGLHWLKDNVFLDVQGAIRDPIYWVSPDDVLMGNYTLIIDNVTVNNAGEYTCVLLNGTGDLLEDNLQIIRKSTVAFLEVVEPEPEPKPKLTTTSHPQRQPSKEAPLFELVPDTKGSVGILLPTSDSGLKPTKTDKGIPGSPPAQEIAPDDGDGSQLLYYILVGISALALTLVIILTVVFRRKCDCKCRCKPPDPEQSCPNPNFNKSEGPDGAEKDIKIESEGKEIW